MGGVPAGHEMGRAPGIEAMLVERPAGRFELRRGSALKPGRKVPLIQLSVSTYAADALPHALAAIPVEKPGSRKAA
jgi:orotate phosphoribosyltransferase